METITLKVENGALREVPKWIAYEDGKNWLAAITKDPQAPGGLGRNFALYGKGEGNYYITPLWKLPIAVEFAGENRYTRPNYQDRWYGVLVELTESYARLVACKTARQAIKLAAKLAAEEIGPVLPEKLNSSLAVILTAIDSAMVKLRADAVLCKEIGNAADIFQDQAVALDALYHEAMKGNGLD